MNDTTVQQNGQPQLSPEDAKAAMGNATFLQDQLLHATGTPQEAPVEGETAPQGGDQVQMIAQAVLQGIAPQIAEMVKGAVKEEMGTFRKEIKDIINEEDTGKENTQ